MTDDRRRIASRLLDVEAESSRRGPTLAPGDSPARIGRIVGDPGVIGATGRFTPVVPIDIQGTEVEGGPGLLHVRDANAPIVVLLLGPGQAHEGDDLICRWVRHRWVAESIGVSTGSSDSPIALPGCDCSAIPPHLTMTSIDPSCNGGMFQSGTLSYRETPAALADLGLGARGFFSDETFTEPSTGDSYYYYFWCSGTRFSLTRVYPTSVFGSPFAEGELYSWTLGAGGNTCDPFVLVTGSAFPGSDPGCQVVISE